MEIRWIVHYMNGETITSEWDSITSFEDFCHKTISSIQLQTKDGELHTLSAKKGQSATFWQRNTYKEDKIDSRSIMKRLSRDVWLDLTISKDSNKPRINVIRDKVR